MTNDLNTLLTALYVLVDDHVVAPRTGRGHRPELTDSELVCLAVAQILLGYHNERRWVRHVHADSELLAMFPAMLGQSGYHRRLKTAQPLPCKAIVTLGGRTPDGVFTRVAQRLLARAAGIWHNWITGVTSKRSLTAFDH